MSDPASCALEVVAGNGWRACPGPVVATTEDGPVCEVHRDDPWATRWTA